MPECAKSPQSCLTLCDSLTLPGFPVHHQLPELTQTHIHWVGDAIQPSHPLLSPSPSTLSHSQHQGLFQWVSSLHQVAKVVQFQLQHQYFQWLFRTDFIQDGLVGSPWSPVQFSRSVVSDSLRPHELQHSRPPCPSPSPEVHSNSRPSSQWCHPAISSSVTPFPPAPNPSQHQSIFQWVSSLHEVAKVLEFQR